MNLKTSVIHRKGAKSAKDAKKIKDLSEMSEGFITHFWVNGQRPVSFCFLCDLCTFAPLR